MGQRSLKVIEINAIRKLGCGFLFSYLPSIVPGERATSCGGRGYKKEAAIFVDVCPRHTIPYRDLILRLICSALEVSR